MRRRWLPWILFVAISTVILIGVRLVPAKLKPPTAILPNGTELSLLAVTHGSNHIFFPGGMWQKLVHRFAPAKGISFWRFRIMPMGPMVAPWWRFRPDGSVCFPDKAVVWIGHRGPTNAPPLPLPEGGQWFSDIRATLADERGEVWDMMSKVSRFRSSTARGLNGVSSWDFTSYPRRGSTLRLRMYARNSLEQWGTLADFKLPNPTPGPYPLWQPSNLPVTRTNGDLEVSLVGLVAGWEAGPKYPDGKKPFTRATLELKQDGRLTEAWLPELTEATDATGNELWVGMASVAVTNNLAVYEIPDACLSPSEVWKLRMKFAKERDSAPEKVWTSPELALENDAPKSLTMNWQNGRITVDFLEDPYRNTIRLKLIPLPKDTKLELREVIDNQGHKVECVSGGFERSGFDAQFKIANGTEWLKITVRLVETRDFEFVAQPTRQ